MIYMFLSNNPSSGGYKFVEFVLFIVFLWLISTAHAFPVVYAMNAQYFACFFIFPHDLFLRLYTF